MTRVEPKRSTVFTSRWYEYYLLTRSYSTAILVNLQVTLCKEWKHLLVPSISQVRVHYKGLPGADLAIGTVP